MILDIVGGLLFAVAILLAIPAVVLLVQVDAASRFARPKWTKTGYRPLLAVLMPAHNEASGIAAALGALQAQLQSGDRLLVVADNCTDDTPAIAASCGAEVVERQNPALRGKGYALDHGIRHLAAAPPEVVIVVDADCIVDDGVVDRLARQCVAEARPIQALYLMLAPPGAGLKQRLAEFAWTVRNEVRPSGWLRLGLPCQLMGTGMAFPWRLISTATLASGSIVEDMQLGLDLAVRGAAPRFCPQARVTSVFPESAQGAVEQRTRWEHGHMGVIVTHGIPLLWRGIVERRFELVAMALDVCVPPLAALVLLLSGLVSAGALMLAVGGNPWTFIVAVSALTTTGVAVGGAWYQAGRSSVALRELVAVPVYVIAKIPIYIRLFTARQMKWLRTRRDGDVS